MERVKKKKWSLSQGPEVFLAGIRESMAGEDWSVTTEITPPRSPPKERWCWTLCRLESLDAAFKSETKRKRKRFWRVIKSNYKLTYMSCIDEQRLVIECILEDIKGNTTVSKHCNVGYVFPRLETRAQWVLKVDDCYTLIRKVWLPGRKNDTESRR